MMIGALTATSSLRQSAICLTVQLGLRLCSRLTFGKTPGMWWITSVQSPPLTLCLRLVHPRDRIEGRVRHVRPLI